MIQIDVLVLSLHKVHLVDDAHLVKFRWVVLGDSGHVVGKVADSADVDALA